jgi:hypothetical protein
MPATNMMGQSRIVLYGSCFCAIKSLHHIHTLFAKLWWEVFEELNM